MKGTILSDGSRAEATTRPSTCKEIRPLSACSAPSTPRSEALVTVTTWNPRSSAACCIPACSSA